MKIAIVGYGKMGKEIEAAARERGFTVSKILTSDNNRNGSGLSRDALKNIDICIEFTSPASVLDNIRSIADAGKDVVVGTTGWQHKLAEVTKLVKEKNIGLFHAPNFSLGVNVYNEIVAAAARLFADFEGYDVAVSEIHHRKKADSPSGTSLALANIIIQNIRRKKDILQQPAHEKIRSEQLHVTSTRVGSVMGRHTVVFDSDADTVEIIHNAKSRRGFALGALIAAEWLKGKKGVFTMKDVLTSR